LGTAGIGPICAAALVVVVDILVGIVRTLKGGGMEGWKMEM